jgi:hypothetical protein
MTAKDAKGAKEDLSAVLRALGVLGGVFQSSALSGSPVQSGALREESWAAWMDAQHAAHAAHAVDPSVLDARATTGGLPTEALHRDERDPSLHSE